MPVSLLMGIAGELPESLAWVRVTMVCYSFQVPKCLRPDRIAYIGLRDVDPGEKKILRDYNIPAYSMYHVDKYGIGKVVEMALDRINPSRDRPVLRSHVELTLDSFIIRCRCSRPVVRSFDRNAGARWSHVPGRMLHLRVTSRNGLSCCGGYDGSKSYS